MSRRAPCGPVDARERTEYAREQLTLAEIGHPWPTTAARKASGAAAVLAAIAAADAICCLRLGQRSRDADHRAAVALLSAVLPEGPDLAKALRIALDAKDPMHYATDYLTPPQVTCLPSWSCGFDSRHPLQSKTASDLRRYGSGLSREGLWLCTEWSGTPVSCPESPGVGTRSGHGNRIPGVLSARVVSPVRDTTTGGAWRAGSARSSSCPPATTAPRSSAPTAPACSPDDLPHRGRRRHRYAGGWLDSRSDLKPRTRELYLSLLDHHILPTLGPQRLRDLTPTVPAPSPIKPSATASSKPTPARSAEPAPWPPPNAPPPHWPRSTPWPRRCPPATRPWSWSPPTAAHLLAQALPHARALEIPRASHHTANVAPTRLTDPLTDFFGTAPPREG